MNNSYILHHLKEAADELNNLIHDVVTDAELTEQQYVDAMKHIYRHINSAFNARNATEKEARECSEENYIGWRQFPTNLDMSE